MSGNKPVVMLDPNEARNEALLHAMRNYYGKNGLVVAPLPVDMAFHVKRGQGLIERKVTPSDLLASIGDGRLTEQVHKLRGAEGGGALLLEGSLHCNIEGYIIDGKRARNYTMQQVWGILQTIQDYGVKIVWSPSPQVTPMIVHAIYTWASKDPDEHSSLKGRKRPRWEWGSPSEREATLFAFQGFGIGPKTAEEAWKGAGSLYNFLMMNKGERTKIKGIGSVRDQKIEDILGKEHPDGKD